MKNNNSQSGNIRIYILCFAIFIVSLFVFDISLVIRYMNDNTGAIQGIFALILIVVTAYYAWQTRKTVEIMRESEKERNRPRLSVYLKQKEDWVNFVYLIIANYGNDVAKDITFSLNTDFELTLGNTKLSEVRQIKDGIKNLTSSRELVIPFLNLVQDFDKFREADIRITTVYHDFLGNKFKEQFILDITSIVEHQVGKPPICEISESLEKISKNTEKIKNEIIK